MCLSMESYIVLMCLAIKCWDSFGFVGNGILAQISLPNTSKLSQNAIARHSKLYKSSLGISKLSQAFFAQSDRFAIE